MKVTIPYAAATDSRFITAALSGTSSERNASRSTMKLSPTTTAIISGSFSEMRLGEVDVGGGLAADVGGTPVPASAARDHVAAQVADEVEVASE